MSIEQEPIYNDPEKPTDSNSTTFNLTSKSTSPETYYSEGNPPSRYMDSSQRGKGFSQDHLTAFNQLASMTNLYKNKSSKAS